MQYKQISLKRLVHFNCTSNIYFYKIFSKRRKFLKNSLRRKDKTVIIKFLWHRQSQLQNYFWHFRKFCCSFFVLHSPVSVVCCPVFFPMLSCYCHVLSSFSWFVRFFPDLSCFVFLPMLSWVVVFVLCCSVLLVLSCFILFLVV